jgi:hypothetical protein
MFRVWLAFALIVASQLTFEATGELDWASPFTGEMYPGEWTVFAGALTAVAYFLWAGFERSPRRDYGSALALSACMAAFLASFEPTRHVRPLVFGWAMIAITAQAWIWADVYQLGRTRRMAMAVAVFQGLCLLLYVYAQSSVEFVALPDGPASALFYLHGSLVNYLPTLLGTLLLAAATLWKRS